MPNSISRSSLSVGLGGLILGIALSSAFWKWSDNPREISSAHQDQPSADLIKSPKTSRHASNSRKRTPHQKHTTTINHPELDNLGNRSLESIQHLYEAGRTNPIETLSSMKKQGLEDEMEFVIRAWIEIDPQEAISWLGKNPLNLEDETATNLMSIAMARQFTKNPELAIPRLYFNQPPNETRINKTYYHELIRNVGFEEADRLLRKEIFQREWERKLFSLSADVFSAWIPHLTQEMTRKHGEEHKQHVADYFQSIIDMETGNELIKKNATHYLNFLNIQNRRQ